MKKIKIFTMLLALALTLNVFAPPLSAEAATADTLSGTFYNLTWTISPDGVLTISGKGAMAEMENGYGDHPWIVASEDEDRKIKKIIIKSGVTNIARDAFEYLDATSVVIPASVKTIGENAFQSNKIKTVKLPEGLRTVKYNAFRDNPITSLSFPKSLKEIGDYAFSGTNIKKITIPATFKKVGLNVFFDSEKLTKVTISKGCTEISEGMFNHCTKLKTVKLPNTIKKIKHQAFRNTAIKTITIPKSVTVIGEWAFQNCQKMKSITIPKSVKKIGKYSIGYVDQMKSVRLIQSKKLVIKCKKKSKAYKYAKKNKLKYKFY